MMSNYERELKEAKQEYNTAVQALLKKLKKIQVEIAVATSAVYDLDTEAKINCDDLDQARYCIEQARQQIKKELGERN
jgi:hypothetical protein